MKPVSRLPLLLCILILAACTPVLHNPVPAKLVSDAHVSDLYYLRYWADGLERAGDKSSAYRDDISQYIDEFRHLTTSNGRKFDILTLSGGGQSGAYGAGLLVGWSDQGSRPEFEIVTGTSTGAIIAPFAFLGKKYDPVLREIYTTISTHDIGQANILAGLTGGDSLLEVSRFERLIAKYITPEVLEEIAEEDRRGRVLLVGTTNLEAERGVIWNMGYLASSDFPDRLDMFRKIIQASAAIPGAFPPVQINVDTHSGSFDELHVDGGVTQQVFMYPRSFSIKPLEKALGYQLKKRVFVVRNTKLTPSYQPIEAKTVPIVGRALNTLIKTQGLTDVRYIADVAAHDGFAFHLTSVPLDFSVKSEEPFDPNFMRPLFERGYEVGFKQTAWRRDAP